MFEEYTMTFIGGYGGPEMFDPKNPPLTSVVRVCCISDTHTEAAFIRGGIPACDILVHAGDITYKGEVDKIAQFNDWGGTIPLPREQKICIAGNHDILFEKDPALAQSLLTNWTYLQDSSVEVLGLKVYGSPWSPAFYPEHWVFNQPRGKVAAAKWAQIPYDADVVIVHGPPFGYGDRARKKHVGCEDLAHRLMTIRARLTVCGHIHEDYGVFAAPWGTVVNASIMDGKYTNNRYAIVVDIPIVEL